jgi:hypothetical protein
MTWNLRVVDQSEGGEDFLEVCEVYYDEIGIPMGYCKASMSGETIEDIQQYLMWALAALDQPVLIFDISKAGH